MSQAPSNPNEIGRGVVSFVGDTSNVKKAAAETVAVTTAAAQQAGAALGQTEKERAENLARNKSAIDDTTESWKKQTSAVTSFISRVAGVVGVATGMYALGQAIREGVISALETGAEKAEKFRMALSGDSKQDLAVLEKEIEKINARLAASMEGWFAAAINSATGDTKAALEAQRDAFQKSANELRQGARKLDKYNAEESAKEAAASGKKANREVVQDRSAMLTDMLYAETEARLQGEEKINYAAMRRVMKLDELRKKATEDELRTIDLIENEIRLQQKQNIEDYRKGMIDASGDIGKSLRKEFASVQQAAANMFPTDKLSLQLTELAKIMERVASNTRNMNG